MPLAAALDALIETHLVQTQRAMEELLERVTYALANEADAASVYAALVGAEKQLESLKQFLVRG
ncbi:hypothetical protein MNAN1_002321 [Malassezia nana]|uniref:Uncharacterized protein n=1 Tax=Malassezia nana TaxID=180528 RepID=A0AAF0J7R7_9BASI|nr:hypothetical protein MNAN1_002321 [Malassezia nana]